MIIPPISPKKQWSAQLPKKTTIGESSLDLPYGAKHWLSILGEARTGARSRASPYGKSLLDSPIILPFL
jgi:hypothetical protein